eukprot:1145431-Pelagomonas_calceolata.AAC.3
MPVSYAQVMVDPRRFDGIEAVPAAVDHLNSGKSIGKGIALFVRGSSCTILEFWRTKQFQGSHFAASQVVVQLAHLPTEALGSKL